MIGRQTTPKEITALIHRIEAGATLPIAALGKVFRKRSQLQKGALLVELMNTKERKWLRDWVDHPSFFEHFPKEDIAKALLKIETSKQAHAWGKETAAGLKIIYHLYEQQPESWGQTLQPLGPKEMKNVLDLWSPHWVEATRHDLVRSCLQLTPGPARRRFQAALNQRFGIYVQDDAKAEMVNLFLSKGLEGERTWQASVMRDFFPWLSEDTSTWKPSLIEILKTADMDALAGSGSENELLTTVIRYLELHYDTRLGFPVPFHWQPKEEGNSKRREVWLRFLAAS